MKRVLLVLLLLIALLGIQSCSGNSIAGGNGAETGNPIVIGTASLITGESVDSLTLIVRKQGTTANESNFSYLGNEFDEKGQLRVPAGEFDFTLQETGRYVVEIRSGDTLSALQYLNAIVGRTYELQEMILDTLLNITGTVQLYGGERVAVDVYAEGIDRTVTTRSDGSYVLPVPRGVVSVKLVPQSEEYLPVEIPYVQAGDSIEPITILAIEPVSTDYECDSLIIRAILDSNRLYTIGVEQVTVVKNGRVVEFDVAADTTQPQLVTISGFITVIPQEIGGLTALEELEIQYTSLTSLPEAIGKLVTLRDLELNDNNLTALPQSIVNINPTGELRLSRNSLVLTPEQILWADKYDPDWEENQKR